MRLYREFVLGADGKEIRIGDTVVHVSGFNPITEVVEIARYSVKGTEWDSIRIKSCKVWVAAMAFNKVEE